MVVTTTTGYILTIFRPFYSDFHNNDASILKHVMLSNYEDILSWVQDNEGCSMGTQPKKTQSI